MARGERIDRVDRAFALALLGVVLNQVVEATVFEYAHVNIYSMLVILWTVAVISAYLQYLAWPALFKALTAYGLRARIPCKRHQRQHLEFCTAYLRTRGSGVRVSPGAPPYCLESSGYSHFQNNFVFDFRSIRSDNRLNFLDTIS
jgi:hypothetical protein